METDEIKKLENLRKLISSYFNPSKPLNDKSEFYLAGIKNLEYNELGYFIVNILKMCALAVDQDVHKMVEVNKIQPINVSLILEMVVEMFPLDEFEMLTEINQMFITDLQK
ncbi:hypothetical protein [Flavobacterium sp. N1736]|uniref:hypothetical protein n=1 Tax=Flavobacterium sp. N1736 TaxID=2986823 RepID=UPI0022252B8E|nr:hypothetical protein [Flavobacterium sp. N1736]